MNPLMCSRLLVNLRKYDSKNILTLGVDDEVDDGDCVVEVLLFKKYRGCWYRPLWNALIPVRKMVAMDMELCENKDVPKSWLKNKSDAEALEFRSYISMPSATRQSIIAAVNQRDGIDYEIVTSNRIVQSDESDDSEESCTSEEDMGEMFDETDSL